MKQPRKFSKLNTLTCPKCGSVEPEDFQIEEQVFKNGTLHYRSECLACGRRWHINKRTGEALCSPVKGFHNTPKSGDLDSLQELTRNYEQALPGVFTTAGLRELLKLEKLGFTEASIIDAMLCSLSRERIPQADKFRYACGILWNKRKEEEDQLIN